MTTVDPEVAVREYLQFLEDPEQLLDAPQIEEAKAELQSAADPIDRLRALARLEKLQHPSADTYRDRFVQHAKAWATANDVPASSFVALGVRADVLREAGLIEGKLADRLQNAKRAGASSRKNTTVDSVKVAVQGMSGTLTLSDVLKASGASPMTVRKALGELTESGLVARLGPDPDWSGQGRAPILYKVLA